MVLKKNASLRMHIGCLFVIRGFLHLPNPGLPYNGSMDGRQAGA